MSKRLSSSLGKALYGAWFVVVLPALLVAWAVASADVVRLPSVRSLPLGSALVAFGALLLGLGIATLWVRGGSAPMNLAPPPRFVQSGIYALILHPIYIGFSAGCVGVALLTGSSSGLWLVSPSVMLCAAALVLGFEGNELRARFPQAAAPPKLWLPPPSATAPTGWQRAAAYLYVLIPWFLLYEAILALGPAPGASSAYLPFETTLPVMPWTEPIYASTYAIVLAAPLLARDSRTLRDFMQHGLFAMALVFPCYLVVPLSAAPRPFTSHGALGALLALERSLDGTACSFPSFHVIWAVLAAAVLRARWPRWGWLFSLWALAVAASCITTGMHALSDVLAGMLVTFIVQHADRLWSAIRATSEHLANSWVEWDLGAVRIINHGAWAGMGTFLALSLVAALSGGALKVALIAAFSGLVLSALSAQLIEGSPRLLRPYGFYGGLLGVTLGTLAAPLFHTSIWLVLAAYCVAAPLVQSFGRVRCLVQGCCHGSLASERIGIRYRHPRSRVVRFTQLAGSPIHPTPSYSILWNLVVALVLGRLWILHAQLHLIGGVYLILSGAGRFVEEHYRGEPQTPIYAKLRLYQWVAISNVPVGALLTAVARSAPAPDPQWHPASIVAAFAFGLITWFALGVDFPRSNARFSRLV